MSPLRCESATPEQPVSRGGLGLLAESLSQPPQQHVELGAVRATDRHAVEPLEITWVQAADLAQRPAAIAAEAQDAARRSSRRWTCGTGGVEGCAGRRRCSWRCG